MLIQMNRWQCLHIQGGDIYLTLFTDKVKYEAEKERTIKFYEEEN